MSEEGKQEAAVGLRRLKTERVIALIDLDCFYAQVEQKRLNVPSEVPLAVQQWQMLIAVNYAARKRGVKRGDSAAIALQKCPEIALVHVQLIGGGGDAMGEGESASTTTTATEEQASSSISRVGHEEGSLSSSIGDCDLDWRQRIENYNSVNSAISKLGGQRAVKVSLERYRIASLEILKIFQRRCSLVERASVDEAFLDLTADIESERKRICSPPSDFGESLVLGADDRITTEADQRLAIGAKIVSQIRAEVKDTLGFTCSSGISHNKMLSKLISSSNKPDGQTVLPWKAVEQYMTPLLLRKIRFLGGKLGKSVNAKLEVETAGDLMQIPIAQLHQHFGLQTGSWLFHICRGVDESEVTVRNKTNSMLAVKSFSCIREWGGVEEWLQVLAVEIAERAKYELEENGRIPKTLTVYYTPFRSKSRTVAGRFPVMITDQAIAKAAREILHRRGDALPMTRLGLQASNFAELPQKHRSAAVSAPISAFFNQHPASTALKKSAHASSLPLKPISDANAPLTPSSQPRQPLPSSSIRKTRHDNDDRNISRFYRRSEHDSDGDGKSEGSGAKIKGLFQCSECRRYVPNEQHQEHMDFHFAQRLMRESAITTTSSAAKSSGVKRKRISPGTTRPSRPRSQHGSGIMSFFQRKTT